ncbi:hypothetical protein LguiB_028973 [Lonicera macranthoides]
MQELFNKLKTVILGKIEELLGAATWNWKAKRNYENRELCKKWGLNDLHVLE